MFFFFKQKPAYELRISDWSSDVCSSDLIPTLEPVNLSAMSEKELAVYRLIRAHYLAQFLPLHEFDRTTARFSCADQTLQAIGKQNAILGWRLEIGRASCRERVCQDV